MGEYIDVPLEGGSRTERAATALADVYTTPIVGLDYDRDGGFATGGSYEELAGDAYSDSYEELAGYRELSGHLSGLADDYYALASYEELAGVLGEQAEQQANKAARVASRESVNHEGAKSKVVLPSILQQKKDFLRKGGTVSAWRKQLRKMLRHQSDEVNDIRLATGKAVIEAAKQSAAPVGSREHFIRSFKIFKKVYGDDTPASRRAFLIAYRADTGTDMDAVNAAKKMGVSSEDARNLSRPMSPQYQIDDIASGDKGPSVMRSGDSLIRPTRKTGPGVMRSGDSLIRETRKAGEDVPPFGGIFAKSIYGKRGRAGF
jgi:hypothetical protein